MKLNKKVIKLLRESLPPGFGPELQKRLEAKGHRFSVQYIYLVLNPDNNRATPTAIIDEAIAYKEELNMMQLQMEEKILSVVN